jgi:hypothetical protein
MQSVPITTNAVSSLRRDVLDTTLCDKVCRLVGGFCLCTPVFSTNKTGCHDITEILLKVALNTITITIIDIRLTHKNVSARLLILTGRKETTEELQRDQPFNFKGVGFFLIQLSHFINNLFYNVLKDKKGITKFTCSFKKYIRNFEC